MRFSLRDTLTLQNPTAVSADAQRTPSGSVYEDVATVRGNVDLDSAKEQVRAGRHEAEQTGTIKMRHRDDVHNESRFIWTNNNDLELNVIGIQQKGRQGRWMIVEVKADRQS